MDIPAKAAGCVLIFIYMATGPQYLIDKYLSLPQLRLLKEQTTGAPRPLLLKGLSGSSVSFVLAAMNQESRMQVLIADEKEEAAYLLNDLEALLGKELVLFFPESYRRAYEVDHTDNANVLMRTETLNGIRQGKPKVVVTYPHALAEKVITQEEIAEKMLHLKKGESVDVDFIFDVLIEYGFDRDDFVYEPGQFAARGGIIDVFSFANDLPYRIEFDGKKVSSIRTFNPDSQLSVAKFDRIDILPNIERKQVQEVRQSFLDFIPADTLVWIHDLTKIGSVLSDYFGKAQTEFKKLSTEIRHSEPQQLFLRDDEWEKSIVKFHRLHYGPVHQDMEEITFHTQGQPPFHKNFDLLFKELEKNKREEYATFVFSDQARQIERLYNIFEDLLKKKSSGESIHDKELFQPQYYSIKAGFIDNDLKIACFTDHQIFERYKRFQLKASYSREQSITLKELTTLKPGDFVTHIDHGVGQFAGLEKIDVNGKPQEAIKLMYKDGDTVYVSIHSLHRIARYSGKEGKEPGLNKIGSNAWQALKAKTKKKVKELAFDLIKLYAKRRTEKGFQFSPDTYLQHELEASFIYEDTPDQLKATQHVKSDMEKPYPMDRLVCGDVGFGKTEVAIRAAFKAVCDGKQVAVLVPTTILALQHYKTFSARLKDFAVTVDYLNRFKSSKAQKETLEKLADGRIDILIGTHKLAGNDVKFRDLGLLIIDEEQKFGVSTKDKLKLLKSNVDTLTLTATPIPRTLQFSLLGARDLSVIRTPPANRYPVSTELRGFNEEVIRDAIMYEVSRNGQVFFIHNRVQNIMDVAGMIQRLCPDVKVKYAHGQMDGASLEEIMLGFIENDFDVLVSTSIVESGLDIPNANTIIINDAHYFGLSDLHQMRGRVGRSNRKAFCYLLTPPFSTLTPEARKRLNALLEFSDLGSGFNIAMKDLDIRGAGDLLGADQSGFINEMGYETYQKILNEALQELKQNEFKELFAEELEKEGHRWVDDCVIDTDLEILIPESYVDNIAERLQLYKELDNLGSEEDIQTYMEQFIDRFGSLPKQTQELFNVIRLRLRAQALGFEKIILKNNTLILHFVSNQQSPYYQSDVFTRMLQFLQRPESRVIDFRQKNDKLTMTFKGIPSVQKALEVMQKLTEVSQVNAL